MVTLGYPGTRSGRIEVITECLVQFSLKSRDTSRWAPAWSQSPLEPLSSDGDKIGLLHLCGGLVGIPRLGVSGQSADPYVRRGSEVQEAGRGLQPTTR